MENNLQFEAVINNLRETKEMINKIEELIFYLPIDSKFVYKLQLTTSTIKDLFNQLYNSNNTIDKLNNLTLCTKQLQMMTYDLLHDCKIKMHASA